MEVHHHPEVEKKGFKEYLLEGLMIFLAVTMGFFAESLREHISDNNREKEYIRSFSEDLKKDTAALHYSMWRLNHDIRACDSIIRLYATNKLTQRPDSVIAAMSYNGGHSVDVFFNDRTSSQLKGTGSMRLIRNKAIADSMLKYWNNQFRLQQMHDRFENIRMEQHKAGWKTFNWYPLVYNWTKTGKEKVAATKAIADKNQLNEFVNVCSTLYNQGGLYRLLLKDQLNLATTIIATIDKQYPPENE
ncbi:MAG TPA: hypothetical protein VHE59_18355 [Mucilaginibacter sp.]|nr:hypothetical protein [Mucilaginibacter sp.]